MRSKANDKGVELFVIDSGDLHDGSGLSDAVKPGGSMVDALQPVLT